MASVSSTAPPTDDTEDRLFTPEFLLLMATGVTYSLGTGALNALLPPFVVDELGGTEATSGIVMGSMAITALLSRTVLGRLSDRRGARRLIGAIDQVDPLQPIAAELHRVRFRVPVACEAQQAGDRPA